MRTITISKFKATCLALLEEVSRTGEPLLVTKRGTPIAQVVPPPPERTPKSTFGAMKGRARIIGDIVGPISSEEEWNAGR